VNAELDRLISKRASQDRGPDPDEQDELWKASVHRQSVRRREVNRQAWAAFHEGQAASLRQTLGNLITYHERRAQELGEIGEA
jgi:hypothetical protein